MLHSGTPTGGAVQARNMLKDRCLTTAMDVMHPTYKLSCTVMVMAMTKVIEVTGKLNQHTTMVVTLITISEIMISKTHDTTTEEIKVMI